LKGGVRDWGDNTIFNNLHSRSIGISKIEEPINVPEGVMGKYTGTSQETMRQALEKNPFSKSTFNDFHYKYWRKIELPDSLSDHRATKSRRFPASCSKSNFHNKTWSIHDIGTTGLSIPFLNRPARVHERLSGSNSNF
jgi:hypothetical protein